MIYENNITDKAADKTTTDALDAILKSGREAALDDMLESEDEKLIRSENSFGGYMRGVLKQKGIRLQDLFIAADISEGYGYKLISGEKHTVRRDAVIRLCLAGRFTLKEADRALKLYGMSPLYSRVPRDAALIIAFNKGVYEISEVDALLARHGMEPLYCFRKAEE